MLLMRETVLYDEKLGSLKSFLLGVTRNFVLRRLKQERAFVSIENAEDQSLLGSVEGESLTQNESIREMRQAILGLPPHYREVVVLCELQELSYAEAAEVLGCAIGTIRSRLHRARTMLTERLTAREDRAIAKEIKSERCFA
jgi:RNA polymerase sigma-70 factor (ECF subfamily)